MTRLRYSKTKAVRHLGERCRHMAAFIDRAGRIPIRVNPEPDLFRALAQAIVYQQLSGKAAQTIHGRFAALFEDGTPSAAEARKLTYEALRGVGLSNNKALSIQDLARKSLDGTLARRSQLVRWPDEAVMENLCQVRGIGPWTAQMLLMFNFGRPDVMPAADLGVQKGVQVVYRMRKLPDPEKVLARTRRLAPYRSVAACYFWHAVDTVLMD